MKTRGRISPPSCGKKGEGKLLVALQKKGKMSVTSIMLKENEEIPLPCYVEKKKTKREIPSCCVETENMYPPECPSR